MLSIFKKLFTQDELPEITSDQRLQLSAAVLMIALSQSDDHVDDVELETINSILSSEYALDEDKIKTLMSESKTEVEDAISLHNFTREICQQCDHTQRVTILTYLWRIAFADGRLDANERHFIRKVANLLYLNDADINLAKAKSEKI